ncbi:terpene synthase [Phlyctochytrium arcticum]|nr:terpene synthase [Phlyctochytrium arcticum]
MTISQNPLATSTDLTRWRLRVDDGRQTWHYLSESEAKKCPQTDVDKYWLGLGLNIAAVAPKPSTPLGHARAALQFYKHLQTSDGHFAGAYGGPHFLTPGYVITMYICGETIEEAKRVEIARYLLNMARDDGGWGIHVEGHSTAFGTALNYVTCRLLGVERDHPAMVKARGCLHRLGSALAVPAWGKFWLSVLGVYSYDGMNPVPPELWLLPYAAPVHPGRWWIHTRMVYLPMGFIYGQRLVGPMTDLIYELREELYTMPYEEIQWSKQCNNVAEADVYYPHTRLLDVLNGVCWLYEKVAPKWLRRKAIEESWYQLEAEDANTEFGDLASVNKPLNMLCTFFRLGKESEEFKKHKEKCNDYIWMSETGMHFNGTDGSQVWDAAFFAQAACESGLAQEPEFHEMVQGTLDFLDTQQIRKDPIDRERCYRDATKGAWPFSKRAQGYTVSDCTAEGMKSVLMLQELSFTTKNVGMDRLRQAVDVLLYMQNSSGGFGTYELTRGSKLLEWINPAEVFGDIMVEYDYPECTTAVVLGLLAFQKRDPQYRRSEIESVTEKALDYVRRAQKEDGSWFGSWAICFTYGTWFGVEALTHAGETYANSSRVQKACEFIVAHQNADGGWGEAYRSCETNIYHNHASSQVVNTAWACLTLMAAEYPDRQTIARGLSLIMQRQKSDGSWDQEAIEGVFNKNAMIAYPNYKFYFSVWALGRWAKLYGDAPLTF